MRSANDSKWQRRQVLAKTSAFVAGVGLSAACTKKDSADTSTSPRRRFNWRLVMVIPKTLPIWGPGVERFAAEVATMSGGALNIKVYGAGEIVPALSTFDAVKAGQVEMAHSASYYWQGKVPAAAYFTAVPFGMNALGMRSWLAYGGGQELWDEVYEPHGVFSLPAGNTGLQMGGWFNRDIDTLEDFKGLKMRIPGLGGKVVAKAGASPVLVAGGEIYTNLTTGVIDATEWVGPYHDYVMGFHKIARNYYYPGWQEPGPVLELMINKKAWNDLPNELQEIVRAAAGRLDRDMYAEWLARDDEYLQKIRSETKVAIKPFPDDVLRGLKAHADAVNAEVAAESPLAERVHASFKEFQRRFEAHQAVTEHAYVKALAL